MHAHRTISRWLYWFVIISVVLSSMGIQTRPAQGTVIEPEAESAPVEDSVPSKRGGAASDHEQPQPAVSLKFAPPFLPPTGSVNLIWKVENVEALAAPSLLITLHPGLAPTDPTAVDYDPLLFTVTIGDLGPMNGVLDLIATLEAGEYWVTADLLDGGQVIATEASLLFAQREHPVSKAGGKIVTLDEAVEVEFPADALNEDALVYARFRSDPEGGSYLGGGGRAFELTAQGKTSKEQIRHFNRPLTMRIHYEAEQFGEYEPALVLMYYDEALANWVRIPSQVDTTNHVLTAQVDHFTLFGFDVSNLHAAQPINVQNFQSSSFSGAGVYSQGFTLPPATGGIQPALGLSYNSMVADGATSDTSASKVGMGWDLTGLGYIQRDTHTDPNSSTDDTFDLVLNGTSGRLLKGSDGLWHTDNESFAKIEYNFSETLNYDWYETSTWKITDKAGNIYTFASVAHYPQIKVNLDTTCPTHGNKGSIYQLTWFYGLTEIQDVAGNIVKINWGADGSFFNYSCGPANNRSTGSVSHASDAYPSAIEYPYPNPKYRVVFNYNEEQGHERDDWDLSMISDLRLFSRRALTSIQMQDVSSSPAKILREYSLHYDYASQTKGVTAVFPNIRRTRDSVSWYGILTLRSITEKVGNPNNLPTSSPSSELRELPAVTFAYADRMHLTEVNNGMGGKTVLTYESVPWYSPATPVKTSYINTSTQWSSSGQILLWPNAAPIRLGQMYKVKVRVATVPANGTETAQGYIVYTGYESGSWANSATFNITSTPTLFEAVLKASHLSTNPGLFYFYCHQPGNPAVSVGDGCVKNRIEIYPLVTRYRVTKQEVIDLRAATNPGNALGTHTLATNYAYSEATVNNSTNSAALVANPGSPYTPAQVEYRGNQIVRTTSPYGLVSYSFYNQDDILKGIANAQFVQTETYANDMDSTTGWVVSGAPMPAIVSDAYSGNLAAKLITSQAFGYLARSQADIDPGETVWLRIKVSGTSPETQVELNRGAYGAAGYRSFRAVITPGGKIRWCYWADSNVVGCHDGSMNVLVDTWYIVALTLGQTHLSGYIFDPASTNPFSTTHNFFQHDVASIPSATPWNLDPSPYTLFVQNSTIGTQLYIDKVSVGQLGSIQRSFYDTSLTNQGLAQTLPGPTAGFTVPYLGAVYYNELKVQWPRLISEHTHQFDPGAGSWISSAQNYEYDKARQGNSQYGNVTGVSKWAGNWEETNYGSPVNWKMISINYTTYYPDPGAHRLSYPAVAESYRCLDNSYTCASTELLGETRYYYDANSDAFQPPTMGQLTGKRTLARVEGPNRFYLDERYAYDAWGNQSDIWSYADEHSEGEYPYSPTNAAHTFTCFGDYNPDTDACSDDGYRVYVGGSVTYDRDGVTRSELNRNYLNKASGLVSLERDVYRSLEATAQYDAYARPVKVILPGFSGSSPTYQVTYAPLTANPLWVEVSERLNPDGQGGSRTWRSLYGGLGQVVQTHQLNVLTNIDLVSTNVYPQVMAGGGAQQVQYVAQSLAYQASAAFRTYAAPAQSTRTSDVWGRAVSVQDTGGLISNFNYGFELINGEWYPWQRTTDLEGRVRMNHVDRFGNPYQETAFTSADTGANAPRIRLSSQYDPVTGQLLSLVDESGVHVAYSYDLLGRVTSVNDSEKSGLAATSTMTYRGARLVSQVTPDAVNGQQKVCYYYDIAERLIGRNFTTTSTPCDGNPTSYEQRNYYDDYGLALAELSDQSRSSYSGSPTDPFGKGHLTAVKMDNGYEAILSYDAHGNLVRQQERIAAPVNPPELPDTGVFVTGWEYTPRGMLLRVTYPGGRNGEAGETVNYGYGTNGQLETMTGAQTYLSDQNYDAYGRMVSATRGGLQSEYTYHAFNAPGNAGALERIVTENMNGTLQDLHYDRWYQHPGQSLHAFQVTDATADEEQVYQFDFLSRLTSAEVSELGASGENRYGAKKALQSRRSQPPAAPQAVAVATTPTTRLSERPGPTPPPGGILLIRGTVTFMDRFPESIDIDGQTYWITPESVIDPDVAQGDRVSGTGHEEYGWGNQVSGRDYEENIDKIIIDTLDRAVIVPVNGYVTYIDYYQIHIDGVPHIILETNPIPASIGVGDHVYGNAWEYEKYMNPEIAWLKEIVSVPVKGYVQNRTATSITIAGVTYDLAAASVVPADLAVGDYAYGNALDYSDGTARDIDWLAEASVTLITGTVQSRTSSAITIAGVTYAILAGSSVPAAVAAGDLVKGQVIDKLDGSTPFVDWLVEAYTMVGTVGSLGGGVLTINAAGYALTPGSQVGAGVTVGARVCGSAFPVGSPHELRWAEAAVEEPVDGYLRAQSAEAVNVSGQQYEIALGSQVSEGLGINHRVTGTAYACPDGKRYIVSLQAGPESAYYSWTYAYDSAGRLVQKDELTLQYSSAHPHAVESAALAGAVQVTLTYNDNGDVVSRAVSGGDTLTFSYTREHKVEKVVRNGGTIPEHWFAYGPDGERIVDRQADGTITFHVGRHYEYSQKGSEVHQKQYYPEAGAVRVDGVLFYLVSDHLGSTSIVTDAAGNKLSEARYDAWGKTRFIAGGIPTDRRYTGQRLSEDLGLYDYRARWYDPLLGRFLMEDTIIAPQGVMSLDRYSYARNAPVVFVDPNGHGAYCGDDYDLGCLNNEETLYYKLTNESLESAEEWFIDNYGVSFVNEDPYSWTPSQKAFVMKGVARTGQAFANELRRRKQNRGDGADVFREIYGVTDGDPFIFILGACDPENGVGGCQDENGDKAGAYTWGPRKVEFYGGAPFMKAGVNRKQWEADMYNIHTVVHELGHAFAHRFKDSSPLDPYVMVGGASFPTLDYWKLTSNQGYAVSPNLISLSGYWRPNTSISKEETFANMFLGFIFGAWANDEYGRTRSDYMTNNMLNNWVPALLP